MIGKARGADTQPRFGGIEAGGTKFVCAIGIDPDHLEAETSFATTTPAETKISNKKNILFIAIKLRTQK